MENNMENNNVNLEVTIEEANYLLFALSKMPFDQVYVLIDKLKKQAEEQIKPTQ
ncbi:hypothetical protein UFOVP787_139 [uncultured Caudovirales phage]|uniref:Uncharacterized protein n=1 Tax=uncultured Caudovirales phage TaxID=2100421 RepID=A0A6J5NYR2_9CAUD|nr:hypothetical protein UFOVP787_139 [uncultured Caudovirales phage]